MSADSRKLAGRPLPFRSVSVDTTSTPAAIGPAANEGGSSAQAIPEFDALYAEHFRFVWRSLRRLGVADASLDDASQDVFVTVHRRLHEYEPRCSPRAWLFAIARRIASDYRRTVRRKGGLASLPPNAPSDPSDEPLESAARNQASRIVLEFLDQLEPEQREVFILSELEQMTAPEIGQALGLNHNTIYSRVRTARRALHDFVVARYPDLLEHLHG